MNSSSFSRTMALPVVPVGKVPEKDALTLGVVIHVPSPQSEVLASWRRSLGDVNAGGIPPHITILPPTQVHRSTADAIDQHLSAVAENTAPFLVHLRGTGTFRPVTDVVFVELQEGAEECAELEQRLRTGVLGRELQFEYHPHVTVAHNVPEASLDRAKAVLAGYETKFTVADFQVHELDGDSWRLTRSYPFRVTLGADRSINGPKR